MRNLIHHLVPFLFKRQSYACCERCRYVYPSGLGACPKCSHLDDEDLEKLIRVRTENRFFIRQMTLIITVLLVAIATVFYLRGII